MTVTWRGEPVAEIRPVPVEADGTIEARLRVLEDRGVFQPATGDLTGLRRISRKRGALERFMGERDE